MTLRLRICKILYALFYIGHDMAKMHIKRQPTPLELSGVLAGLLPCQGLRGEEENFLTNKGDVNEAVQRVVREPIMEDYGFSLRIYLDRGFSISAQCRLCLYISRLRSRCQPD